MRALARQRFGFRRPPVVTAVVFVVTATTSVLGLLVPGVLAALQRTPQGLHGDWWRSFTSLFVQDGGVVGTVSNLAFLLVLGVLAEQVLAAWQWLVCYFGAGLVGQLAGYAWQPRGDGRRHRDRRRDRPAGGPTGTLPGSRWTLGRAAAAAARSVNDRRHKESTVMVELHTRYLGLDLRSPLVASASPLTGSLDGLRRLEDAGAAAVVLPSLFEEQLSLEAREIARLLQSGADSLSAALALDDYNAGPFGYLALVEKAKASLQIPVIASLNGVTPGAWVEHATLLEEAGADALELNVYYVSSSPGLGGSEVEWRYLELVRAVRQAIGIPLAVKLSPYFSSVANLARQLVEAGANGWCCSTASTSPTLTWIRWR